MTGERKIRANRANARAGPFARGAKRASPRLEPACIFRSSFVGRGGNARARNCRMDANAEIRELARHIAEAQIDLRRVRYARHQLISQALSDPDYKFEVMHRKKSALVIRYARRFDLRMPMPEKVMKFLNSKPEGPHKFPTILAEKPVSCSPLTAMNGAPCRDANLPFEPSMRRASRNLTSTPETAFSNRCSSCRTIILQSKLGITFWQNKAKKLNLFCEPKSQIAHRRFAKDAARLVGKKRRGIFLCEVHQNWALGFLDHRAELNFLNASQRGNAARLGEFQDGAGGTLYCGIPPAGGRAVLIAANRATAHAMKKIAWPLEVCSASITYAASALAGLSGAVVAPEALISATSFSE